MNPNQIDTILHKLTEYARMDNGQRVAFYKNIAEGFVLNIMKEGQNLYSVDTLAKLQETPSKENLHAFVADVYKTDEGAQKIQFLMSDILDQVLRPLIPKLNQQQRVEILSILEPDQTINQK